MQARIIGYTRDHKGKVISHHLQDHSNTLCAGGGGTTMQYVIEMNDTINYKGKELYEGDGLYICTGPDFFRGGLHGVSRTLKANMHDAGVVVAEPNVLRMQRTQEEKQRRHFHGDKGAKFSNAKELSPRTDGITNTLTSATKDNLLMEQETEHTERKKRLRIRKLTPVECLRLMGVNDTDIEKLTHSGVSNSQLYKQAGNSIVVDCLEHIFRKMFIDTKCEETAVQLTLF